MKHALPLFAVLAASLVIATPAPAAVDQALLALAPESTTLVTAVDVDAARNSDFGQYLLRRMDSEDQQLQDFISDTGFDPRRDLQNLLFASSSQRRTQSRSRFAILARGNFDIRRISATVRANNNITRQSYGGTTLFVKKEQHDPVAFAFPDTGIVALGDLTTVKQILDRRANPTTLDPGLLQRINQIGASHDVWFVSLLSGSFLGSHIDLPPAASQLKDSSALQSVLQSMGGVQFGDQVKLSFNATTRSSEDATSLADVLRLVSSLIQTQRHNDQNASIIAATLDKMELQTSGPELNVELSISEKNLELLAQSESKHGQ